MILRIVDFKPVILRIVDFNTILISGQAFCALNTVQASQVWRALHDLVILRIVDFKPDCPGPALEDLWRSVADEQLLTYDEGSVPDEGSFEYLMRTDTHTHMRACRHILTHTRHTHAHTHTHMFMCAIHTSQEQTWSCAI